MSEKKESHVVVRSLAGFKMTDSGRKGRMKKKRIDSLAFPSFSSSSSARSFFFFILYL